MNETTAERVNRLAAEFWTLNIEKLPTLPEPQDKNRAMLSYVAGYGQALSDINARMAEEKILSNPPPPDTL